MQLTYRHKLIFIITSLSVLLTTVSMILYYNYTYGIIIDSLSKNLKDDAGLIRVALNKSDIKRIERLEAQITPYIKYSPKEIDYMMKGGDLNNIPKAVISRIQSGDDFQYLAKKLARLMMATMHEKQTKEPVFESSKTITYSKYGLIEPYIVFTEAKNWKYNIVQNIVSPAYAPAKGWPGNPIGTAWRTELTKDIADKYTVYVNTDLFTDSFYTAIYSSTALYNDKGKVIAYLQVDYPAGSEVNKLKNLRIFSYILIFFSFCLSFALSYAVSGRMSGSLKKLTYAANRIRNNDYTAKVDIPRQDEFGMLGNAFNQMADAVNTTTTNLRESNERLRSLTADMHDGVGAVLASIQIACRNHIEHDVGHVGRLASQGMSEIRFLMDAIEYDRCTFELLSEGISLLAIDILQSNCLTWELLTDGDKEMEIPFKMYLDVQRIAREAFTNIIKHSASKSCVAKLKLSGREISLLVDSDGEPLAEPMTASGGRGLQNMRYRVGKYNGTMSAEQRDAGFRLCVMVIIPEEV